jgi:hypothetical protein
MMLFLVYKTRSILNSRLNKYMYVYKIVLNIDDREKFYIGKCETGDINYCGSGKILKRYYSKYGKDIIKEKQILYETNDVTKLNEAEKFFIQKYNATENKDYLNIAGGGEGGNTFSGLSRSEIDAAMKKRAEFYEKNPHVLEQRIIKYKKTINTADYKARWKQELKKASPKRISSYKETCSNRTDEQKKNICANISNAVKKSLSNIPAHIKQERKNKEMYTKSQRTAEQKKYESMLKSEASKKAAIMRASDSNKKIEYSKKVSNGVKQWKSRLTSEEKKEITRRYKITCYTKNGMFQYKQQVEHMILEGKTSLEIFHYLKQVGIDTHHICVKGFIDFLNLESNL